MAEQPGTNCKVITTSSQVLDNGCSLFTQGEGSGLSAVLSSITAIVLVLQLIMNVVNSNNNQTKNENNNNNNQNNNNNINERVEAQLNQFSNQVTASGMGVPVGGRSLYITNNFGKKEETNKISKVYLNIPQLYTECLKQEIREFGILPRF